MRFRICSRSVTPHIFPAQITNLAFILGLYSGVPFKCSFLSVSTHFERIARCPSFSRLSGCSHHMGIAALNDLYFSHSAVLASIIRRLSSGDTFRMSTIELPSASAMHCAMKDLSSSKSSSRSMARTRSKGSCALRKTVKPVQASVSSTLPFRLFLHSHS